MRRTPLSPAFAAVTFASLLAGGCALDTLKKVEHVDLSTHVDDWRDQIIYQVLTDRFANGEARNDWRVDFDADSLAHYKGGDWQGIMDRMDYLQELGVTAIWISPIVLNVDTDAGIDGYHGYWAIDFTKLNPHFGDLATLRSLVNEAHARGILVILDLVTNHMGQAFYYDINLNGQPDESVYGSGAKPQGASPTAMSSALSRVSEYDPDFDPRGVQAFTSLGPAGPAPIHFFHMPEIFRIPPQPPLFQDPTAFSRKGRILDYSIPEQRLWGDFPGGLKDINTRDPRVRETLTQVYVDWVLQTDLDGFRIDTIKHVDYGFWQFFLPQVRERLAAHGKNNFFMFGEVFDGNDDLIGSYTQPGLLDSVFYFSQKFQIIDGVFQNGGPTDNIRSLLSDRMAHYGHMPQQGGVGVPPDQVLVNFIDNHDVPRFLFGRQDPQGKDALKAALTYLLTEQGVPCVYYGTEQGFHGGNDPANRAPLWWSGYDTQNPLFQHIARLTRIRKHYAPLRRGVFDVRYTTPNTGDAPDAGYIAFERRTDSGGYVLVLINAQGAHDSVPSRSGESLTVTAPANAVLRDLLTGDRFTVAADQSLATRLAPYEARILVPEAAYQEF